MGKLTAKNIFHWIAGFHFIGLIIYGVFHTLNLVDTYFLTPKAFMIMSVCMSGAEIGLTVASAMVTQSVKKKNDTLRGMGALSHYFFKCSVTSLLVSIGSIIWFTQYNNVFADSTDDASDSSSVVDTSTKQYLSFMVLLGLSILVRTQCALHFIELEKLMSIIKSSKSKVSDKGQN